MDKPGHMVVSQGIVDAIMSVFHIGDDNDNENINNMVVAVLAHGVVRSSRIIKNVKNLWEREERVLE